MAQQATIFNSTLLESPLDVDSDKRRLILSVGELARLAADSNRSYSSPSLSLRGRLGGAAHRTYQELRRKSGPYRQEVHLDVPLTEAAPESSDWEIRIRGRLDGLIEEIGCSVIEEIKSVALPSARFDDLTTLDYPRHQRQLEIYLHLLSIARPEKPCTGRLIYINLPDGKQRFFEIDYQKEEIEPLLEDIISSLVLREMRRSEELILKREIAPELEFPFPDLRPGQDEIISGVSEALDRGRDLLLEAPTGLGKTAAVLFAALRFALDRDRQVMFLTSKTTQQDLIFKTAGMIRSGRPFPRTLLLRARHKSCPLDVPRCHPDECPYLDDFQQRFRRSRVFEMLRKEGEIHPDRLAEIGERQKLCPHEMQLALCEEADLIIGDYNYAFDPGCRLISLFEERDPSRLILIVDEAHNLPDRARSYYSAKLSWASVQDAVKKLEGEGSQTFNSVLGAIQTQFEYYLAEAPGTPDPFPIQLSCSAWERIARDFEVAVIPYWYKMTAADDTAEEDPVLSLHRNLDSFTHALSFEGEKFAHLLHRSPAPALEVLCLDAAPYLKDGISAVHSAVCMSATLQPFDAYIRMLGLDHSAASVALQNPFPSDNCRIVIDPSVTTLYREREENIEAITRRIERFHSLFGKNVLAFFPSFELMNRIVAGLKIRNVSLQEEGMSDAQRTGLLKAFKRGHYGLLCSVMGGVFAEGIDLPGELAEAAVVVGVGLPQVCTENQMIRAYYDRLEGRGFDYAYLFPGMRRVIQAVGRIIRSESDRGLILLLDRRYADDNYQRLFPRHWYQQSPDELICEDWEGAVEEFKAALSK